MPRATSLRLAFSARFRPALLPLAILCGCGGAWPEVDNPRWFKSIGSPHVRRVRDLGTRVPPQSGRLQGESDGVAAPGEYLLIEGSGFGKSPAVTIDGRSAEVVARTVGAGIVARVPGGVRVGPRPVEVAVGEARSRRDFSLRRLAVVLHGGALSAFAVDGPALTSAGPAVALPGASSMVMSHDGAYAYVLAGSQLRIVDLGAAGGPRLIGSRDVRVPATALAAALRAPRLLAVADGAVQIFETTDPRAPAPYQNSVLPPETRGAVRADVDPDGKRLALMIPEGNRIVVVDVANPARPRLLGDVGVLPEARVPLVRDLRFAPGGDFIYVVSGDGPGSLAVGKQPTRLSALTLERPEGSAEGEVQLSVWRTGSLPAAWAPLRLEAARVAPLASGATVRLPPDRTPVRFSSVDAALLAAGAAERAEPLQGAFEQGDASGEALRLAEPHLLIGTSAGSPDDGWLVATAVRADAGKRDFGLLVVMLTKPPAPAFTAIAPATAADLAPPFAGADVALQP